MSSRVGCALSSARFRERARKRARPRARNTGSGWGSGSPDLFSDRLLDYKQRKAIVEPVSGQIKEGRGLRRFLLDRKSVV